MVSQKEMPDWEVELRAKLEKELPDGFYQLGFGRHQFGTGKGGKINFEVRMHRLIRERKDEFVTDAVPGPQPHNSYKHYSFTESEIRGFLEEIVKKMDNG